MNPIQNVHVATAECQICHRLVVNYGTCRLYNGLLFELDFCPQCKTYGFSTPLHPEGSFTHQAFTLTQIFAETGGFPHVQI